MTEYGSGFPSWMSYIMTVVDTCRAALQIDSARILCMRVMSRCSSATRCASGSVFFFIVCLPLSWIYHRHVITLLHMIRAVRAYLWWQLRSGTSALIFNHCLKKNNRCFVGIGWQSQSWDRSPSSGKHAYHSCAKLIPWIFISAFYIATHFYMEKLSILTWECIVKKGL